MLLRSGNKANYWHTFKKCPVYTTNFKDTEETIERWRMLIRFFTNENGTKGKDVRTFLIETYDN